jgi:UDP-N-acetylmuramoylalanine--D-glutamate ligase
MTSPAAGPRRPAFDRALVIGLGSSGTAAAALLRGLDTEVVTYDRQAEADFSGGEPPPEAFAGIDLMVLSPGVPPARFRALHAQHAPGAAIHGELGLALRLLPALPPLVLITGTNGKSTVTAMVGHLLGSQRPFVGGNLGDPPSDLTREILAGQRPLPSHLVLECSSYQLETLPPLPTEVGMVLNVTPDHLDRYASMEDYARTKARVFAGLVEGGLALLDADDDWTPTIAPPGATLVGGELGFGLPLPGRHNEKNAMFAVAAARHLGVSEAQCRDALATFEGLPHRMAFVRELDGVRWYNDSKATNVASALASVGGLHERFVLIAGGLAKGDDLRPLCEVVRTRGRGLVAIGDAAPQFLALAQGAGRGRPRPRAIHARSMAEAVAAARALARPGDVVVLAPACASFDQYRNFAERGEAFTTAVLAL